jgi:uncharacterized protein with FMN-binding domain
MRRTITTLLTAAVLTLPVTEATAAVKTTTKKVVVVTKRFTGTAVEAGRWGPLQVTILVRKTTTITAGKRKVTRKLKAVSVPVYPNHTDRSVFINSQALPILKSEALRAQTANIALVSGASDSSEAFAESLQSAILKAKHA